MALLWQLHELADLLGIVIRVSRQLFSRDRCVSRRCLLVFIVQRVGLGGLAVTTYVPEVPVFVPPGTLPVHCCLRLALLAL